MSTMCAQSCVPYTHVYKEDIGHSATFLSAFFT